MDWNLPGSSVHGISQARILGWVAISFSGRVIFLTHLLWNYISITIQFSSCTLGHFSSFHFNSVTKSCPTLCDSMDRSTPGFPVHHQIPKLTQTQVHRVDDAIQPSHPLLSPSPHTFNLFQHQGLFIWVSSSHQLAKVSSSNFSINPSNEYSGLISFRMDWLDLLAVQRTFKSLLQHHSSKASILQCSELMLFASLRFWIIYLILPIGTQNNVS